MPPPPEPCLFRAYSIEPGSGNHFWDRFNALFDERIILPEKWGPLFRTRRYAVTKRQHNRRSRMDQAAPTGNVRRSRFWLYTPFVLLLLLAIAWSIAWFVIRNRTAEALDGWIAAEVRAGRQWTCADRTIAGYPFRIEVICNALDLKRGAVSASFGRTEAVAQVYEHRRIITEVAGPLKVTDGSVTVQGSWDLLQASLNTSQRGMQRVSV